MLTALKSSPCDALDTAARVRALLEHRRAFLSSAPKVDDAEAEWAAAPMPEIPNGNGPRTTLVELFGLSSAEAALLDVSVAVAIDSALEELVADLQGRPWRPLPTEALVRRLMRLPTGAIWRPTGALARWQLVTPVIEPSGSAPSFRADPRIVDWYFAKASLDEGLVGHCRIREPLPGAPDWPITRPVAALNALEIGNRSVRLHVIGAIGTGRAEICTAVARALGHEALEIDGAGIAETELPELYLRLQRFAALTGRVPVWTSMPRRWPKHLEAVPLQAVVLCDRSDAPVDGAAVYEMRHPGLNPVQRAEAWAELSNEPLPTSLYRAELAELRASAPLVEAGPGLVETMVRDRALSDLSVVGRVVAPQMQWDDLVLPPVILQALADYAHEARTHGELMALPEIRRIFAKDGAPTALFTGPPGTGKTMAAECIATELRMPLLVIDCSKTVSKFIGETAKNLSRVFFEARRHGCILFFDEADAYFSKRTELRDSHDRHANADTGHLLQLIEDYEGIVVLCTNKRANIDEAFTRRIRHCVEFRKPAAAERNRLWLILASCLFDAQEIAAAKPLIETCAKRFEFTPAQIKSAILTARYRRAADRQTLAAPHLMAGIRKELEKEGRSLPPDLVHMDAIQEEEVDDVT